MNAGEAIKKILKEDIHEDQKWLAKELGVAFSTLNTIVRKGNPTMGKLLWILDKLGYEVVLRPKKGTNISGRSIVIDSVRED